MKPEKVTTTCNLCSRKIKDTFHAKWEHVIKYHPLVPIMRLLPGALKVVRILDNMK